MSQRKFAESTMWKGKHFVNLTAHAITVKDDTVFYPTGKVATLSPALSNCNEHGVAVQEFLAGTINLPGPKEDTIYIVPSLVMARVHYREDVVAPISFGPDVVRAGQKIRQIPGFYRLVNGGLEMRYTYNGHVYTAQYGEDKIVYSIEVGATDDREDEINPDVVEADLSAVVDEILNDLDGLKERLTITMGGDVLGYMVLNGSDYVFEEL